MPAVEVCPEPLDSPVARRLIAERGAELSRDYLRQVRILGDRVGVYKSMLYKPAEYYTRSLDEALLATASAAWRGSGQPQGTELVRGLSDYITAANKKVKIIPSGQVPMGGSSGLVPVSIQNGLHQAIQVRVVANVVNTPGRASQLTIGRFQDLLVIQRSGSPSAAPGPERDPILVPFVAAIVPEVDVKAGRLIIDPPAGLLDLGAAG